ncbi:hypothetical protein GCM10020369_08790 [Cryptosporangium minutisporangium]|uniref:Uncharacterized protein n=1 Tax=Cryptosporangium minutisporangium TaxID=113569 RepID=A0ABP6SRY1_9ACTN
MPVEVLAGSVVAHRRSWIGVAGGELDVAEADAGVEHRGDEGVAEHVRVRPGHPDSGGRRERLEPTGRGVPIHRATASVAQDRPGGAFVDGTVERASNSGWEWYEDDLAFFAADAQDAVACSSPRSAMSA